MTTATRGNQIYNTLDGRSLYLGDLSRQEQRVLAEIQRAYELSPDWASFSNSWREKMRNLYKDLSPKKRTSQPIYLVGEDLEARLGIAQNHFRVPDLRDELRQLIDEKFQSRYAFCQATGLDEGFVSRILRKSSGISVGRLDEALRRVGWELKLTKVEERISKGAKSKATRKK